MFSARWGNSVYMAWRWKLQDESSARTDDGSAGGQHSNYNLWPQRLKSLSQRVDSVIGLLQRTTHPGSETLRSNLHELEGAWQDFKAELNQMQQPLSLKTEPPGSFTLAEISPGLSDEAHSHETEQISTQDALQQAEQLIKHQRGILELNESTQRSDTELSNTNVIQHEQSKEISTNLSNSNATSVMVGRGNTAVIQSTIINIINTGKNNGQGNNLDLCEILKSVPYPLRLSVKEMPQEQANSDISSEGATLKVVSKELRLEKELECTGQLQGNHCSSLHTDKVTIPHSQNKSEESYVNEPSKHCRSLPESLNKDEFSRVLMNISRRLTRAHCVNLAAYFNMSRRTVGIIEVESETPGLRLLNALQERHIINTNDVTRLQKALADLNLKDIEETLASQFHRKIDPKVHER